MTTTKDFIDSAKASLSKLISASDRAESESLMVRAVVRELRDHAYAAVGEINQALKQLHEAKARL